MRARAGLTLGLLTLSILGLVQCDRGTPPAGVPPPQAQVLAPWRWHYVGGLLVVEGELAQPAELTLKGRTLAETARMPLGPVRWEMYRPPPGEVAELRTAEGTLLARWDFDATPEAAAPPPPPPKLASLQPPPAPPAPAPKPVPQAKPAPEPVPQPKPVPAPAPRPAPAAPPQLAQAAPPQLAQAAPPQLAQAASPKPAPAPLAKPAPVPVPHPWAMTEPHWRLPAPVHAPARVLPPPAVARVQPPPALPAPPPPAPRPAAVPPPAPPAQAKLEPRPVPPSPAPKPAAAPPAAPPVRAAAPPPAPAAKSQPVPRMPAGGTEQAELHPIPPRLPVPVPAPPPAAAPQPAAPLPAASGSDAAPGWPGAGEGLYLLRGPKGDKRICLSFDGGSTSEVAVDILDVLKAHGIRTTIFLTGDFIRRYPDLVLRMVREGHELGNHTMTHPHMAPHYQRDPRWTRERMQAELLDADRAFYRLTGRPMDPFWRPPFGEQTLELRKWAEEVGYRAVGWSEGADTLDWTTVKEYNLYRNGEATIERLEKRMKKSDGDGLIVLMHLGSMRPAFDRPARYLGPFMDRAIKDGWHFVKVSDYVEAMGRPQWDRARRVALLNAGGANQGANAAAP